MSSAAVQSSIRAGAAIWLSPLLLCSGHCSPAHTMRIIVYNVYACKIICERQDTRFRLRLCIRIRAGQKERSRRNVWRMYLGLDTAPVFYPYLALAKISHISSSMIWWLVVCCSSPLVRVIVLPCSFYYPSLFLQPSLDVASPRPSSQSRAPPGLILMVLSKIHLAAQLRCQRRSLHSTTLQLQFTASVEMFF